MNEPTKKEFLVIHEILDEVRNKNIEKNQNLKIREDLVRNSVIQIFQEQEMEGVNADELEACISKKLTGTLNFNRELSESDFNILMRDEEEATNFMISTLKNTKPKELTDNSFLEADSTLLLLSKAYYKNNDNSFSNSINELGFFRTLLYLYSLDTHKNLEKGNFIKKLKKDTKIAFTTPLPLVAFSSSFIQQSFFPFLIMTGISFILIFILVNNEFLFRKLKNKNKPQNIFSWLTENNITLRIQYNEEVYKTRCELDIQNIGQHTPVPPTPKVLSFLQEVAKNPIGDCILNNYTTNKKTLTPYDLELFGAAFPKEFENSKTTWFQK